MPEYVIYARKSTESEDRQVLSIPAQIQELERVAARQGVRVGRTLTESKSAKAPGRVVFGSLMRDIYAGKVRGVLCWKMDRLARNHLDTGQILQALADDKLERVITSDQIYTRDSNDRLMGGVVLGMATKFIDDLRANVKRGIRARAERGWLSSKVPQGYLNDQVAKTIVDDPERFGLVRRVWELVLTGTIRLDEVLRIANEDWGYRTRKTKRGGGKPLSRSGVYRMLSNSFYAGIVRLPDGSAFKGAHRPMVTLEEFDRVQAILGRPGRERPQKHEFTFAGLLRCGNCGRTITPEAHVKPSGRRYVYYRCASPRTNRRCMEPAVSEGDLEAQLARYFKRLAIPDEVLAFLRDRLTRTLQVETGLRSEVRSSLEKAIAHTHRKEENLLSLRLRDSVDDETFERMRADLQTENQRLQARLASLERNPEETVRVVQTVLEFAARLSHHFESGTGFQRRSILEAVSSNSALRGRKVALQLKNPFSAVAEAGACSNWQGLVDEVRTIVEQNGGYVYVPDLTLTEPPISMPLAA